MRHQVREELRIEEVGDELLVLDSEGGQAHALTGRLADALRTVMAGGAVPEHLAAAVEDLEQQGIIDPAGWSRRKALLAGGVGAATAVTGLVSMQLPAAAAASSCTNAGTDSTFGTAGDDLAMTRVFATPGAFNFKTGTMVTMITVNIWGAGGSGGTGGGGDAGGGGGGGGFASATLTVAPCTVFSVTVGAGGGTVAGTGPSMNGMDGGSSTFSILSGGGGMAGQGSTGSLFGMGGPGGAGGGGTLNFSGGAGGAGDDGPDIFGDGGGGGGGGAAGVGGNGMAGAAGGDTLPGAGGLGTGGGGNGAVGGWALASSPTPGSPPFLGIPGLGGAVSPGGGGGGGGGQNVGQPSAGAPGRVEISLAP